MKRSTCLIAHYRKFSYRAWLTITLIVPTLFTGTWAGTEHMQSHSSIEAAVKQLINNSIGRDFPSHEIRVGKLDPRLQLAACEQPLRAFFPPGNRLPGNTTVGVICEGQKPWTLYLSAEVKARREVVVTQRPLLRGALISAEDIRLELRQVGSSQDYFTEADEVIGKLAKRPLASRIVISPQTLSTQPLIRRGQQIVIVAAVPGIDVRMQGTALSDGAKGDRITVRNVLSKRTVEATVIQAGVVEVTL